MPLLHVKPIDFDQVWNQVERAVKLMITSSTSFSHEEWLELYTGIYKVCTQRSDPQAEALYFKLKALLTFHVEEKLKKYHQEFILYSTGIQFGQELFAYLNRYWIKAMHCESGQTPLPGVYPVGDMSLRIWHDVLFLPIKERLIKAVLSVFHSLRNEDQEDDPDKNCLLANIHKTFVDLGRNRTDSLIYYKEYLEKPFLEEMKSYYTSLSLEWLQMKSISNYLKETENWIKKEEKRCEECLHRITVDRAKLICWQTLLGDHAEELCTFVDQYFQNDQREDLERMFRLLSMTNNQHCILLLKNVVKKYIEKDGMRVISHFSDEAAVYNPVDYIEAILTIRLKYHHLVESTFSKNLLMISALDQACGKFMNKHPKSAELLARYSHVLLDRVSGKGTPKDGKPKTYVHIEENLIEKKIHEIGVIFCLLEDKDIFEKFYSKYLAKRLIHETSISEDLEVAMIQKLRDLCGAEFVSKLQRMITDKRLNQEINDKFTKYLSMNDNMTTEDTLLSTSPPTSGLPVSEFLVLVLTSGSWPLQCPKNGFVVPAQLQTCVQRFTEYYASQSTGRCLHWNYQMSRGELAVNCFSKHYDFQVSTFQMAILLLFNDMESLTIHQIKECTQLSLLEIQLNVSSFIKLQILNGQPKQACTGTGCSLYTKRNSCTNNKNNNLCSCLDPETLVSLNYNFSSKRSRIKIVPLSYHETPQEAKVTNQEISEDRKMAVQAAIVRVMKTRKEIDHNTLIVQVVELLGHQFVPSVQLLKKNIEILIEKEYMKRLEGSLGTYVYIA